VTGAGGLLGARMAVEDFGGTVKGAKIEVIGGDHQNKPDIASGSRVAGSTRRRSMPSSRCR